MDAVFERLTQVVHDVFSLHHDESVELTEQTTAEDVPGWDSLMHVTIIVQVERAFQIKLASAEIGNLKKLGDLAQLVRKRLALAGRAVAA